MAFVAQTASFLLVFKICLAALGCFGYPVGNSIGKPYPFYIGGLALFILLILLILGA